MSTTDSQTATRIAAARQRFASGRLSEAEELCLEVLATRDDEPNALLILAASAAAQQRVHEAATLLLFGRTRHPEAVSFHRALSDLYLSLGDFENAIEPLEASVLTDPEEPAHRGRLVALYENCRFTRFRQSSKLAMLACLRDEQLSPSQAESLEMVVGRGRELVVLIETILDAARVEAGQLQLLPAPVDIRSVLAPGPLQELQR